MLPTHKTGANQLANLALFFEELSSLIERFELGMKRHNPRGLGLGYDMGEIHILLTRDPLYHRGVLLTLPLHPSYLS